MARKLATPRPCVYCGLVSDRHAVEPRSWSRNAPRWCCRDVRGCGERIREAKRVAGIPADKSDLPF